MARIVGLDALVPASIRTVDPAPIAAAASTSYCGLEGPVWGEGNILLGGSGNDQLEGRGANDILDGDRYLSVRISVRAGIDANGNATGAEIGSTDLMEHAFQVGNPMTLQQAVFARIVNPGQLVIVRELLNDAPGRTSTRRCSRARPPST